MGIEQFIISSIAAQEEIKKKEEEKDNQRKKVSPKKEGLSLSEKKKEEAPEIKRSVRAKERGNEEEEQGKKIANLAKYELERILESKGFTPDDYNTISENERLEIEREAEEKARFKVMNEKTIEDLTKRKIEEEYPDEPPWFIGGSEGFKIRKEIGEELWGKHQAELQKEAQKIEELREKIKKM